MTSHAFERVRFLVLHSRKGQGEVLYVNPQLFEAFRIEEAQKREAQLLGPADIFEALIARAFNVLGVWVKPAEGQAG